MNDQNVEAIKSQLAKIDAEAVPCQACGMRVHLTRGIYAIHGTTKGGCVASNKPTHVYKIASRGSCFEPRESIAVFKIAITRYTGKLIHFEPCGATGYARSVTYPLNVHSGFFTSADDARADWRAARQRDFDRAAAELEWSKEIPLVGL